MPYSVRILNFSEESFDYDDHKIMDIDFYLTSPHVDIFPDTPPAWSSFGNKTIRDDKSFTDDSYNQSLIEKRNKEITAYKKTLSDQLNENEKRCIKARNLPTEAIAAREKM